MLFRVKEELSECLRIFGLLNVPTASETRSGEMLAVV